MRLLSIGGPPVSAQEIGVTAKPAACRTLCPYFTQGEGFSGENDVLPPNAKIMVMIGHPSSDDLVNRRLMSGRGGYSFYKQYIYPLGYEQDDVAVTAVMRCKPKGNKFPLGRDKKALIEACRYYDKNAIKTFNPDVYILSQPLYAVRQEPAFHSLMVRDFAKAFEFAARGFRPIVLMGQEASGLLAPFIDGQGGVKRWRGDWHEIPVWPFLQAGSNEPKPKSGFSPARW